MSTKKAEGRTPSERLMAQLPIKPRFTVGDETYFDQKDAAQLTGLTVRSLQIYSSHRRCNRFLGPKPTKFPGNGRIFYTAEDLFAFIEHGHTGAPVDPNGEASASDDLQMEDV